MNRSTFNIAMTVYFIALSVWQVGKWLLGDTWVNLLGAAVNLLLAWGSYTGWDREQMFGRFKRVKPEIESTNGVTLRATPGDWERSYERVYVQAITRYEEKERTAREHWWYAPTELSIRRGLMEKYERRKYLTFLLTQRYREVYIKRGWNSKYGIVYSGDD